MALMYSVLRTCGLLLYLIFHVHAIEKKTTDVNIQSLKVGSVTCDTNNCKYLLNVTGGEFIGHYPWRLTSEEGARGSNCETLYSNYELKEIVTSQWFSTVEVLIPNSHSKIYFCVRQKDENSPFGGIWVHQGSEHFLEAKNDVDSNKKTSAATESPKSTSSPDQDNDTQANTVTDETDQNNEQKDVSNEIAKDVNIIQEANRDWADLTHDIDVNYLPSITRPPREESNYIEVLFHNKYVPINDLIDNKRYNEVLLSDNTIPSIKRDIKNNLEDIHEIQEVEDRNVINNYNAVNRKANYYKLKRNFIKKFDYNFDKLKSQFQSMECDKLIEELRTSFEKLNSVPIMDEIRRRIFPDEEAALNNIPYISKVDYEEDTDTLLPDEVKSGDNLSDKIGDEVLNTYFRILIDSSNDIKKTFKDKLDQDKNDKTRREILEPFSNDVSNGDNNAHIRKPRHVMYKSNQGEPNARSSRLMPDLENFNLDYSTDLRQVMPDSSQDKAHIRKRRQFASEAGFTTVRSTGIVIEGLRIEDSDKEPKIIEEGIPSVLADTWVTLRVYGEGLTDRTVMAFTHDEQPYGQPCKFLLKGEYKVIEGSLQPKTALFRFRAPSPITGSKLYICAKNLQPGVSNPDKDEEKYAHMGTETWKMLASHQKLLPLWVSICLILVCLMFSALFSGLNLGLMSLDRTELKIISNTGTEQERKYARTIMPVRDHGNYLLCSILLGNVAVNSTFTILLDELTSGLFAVIFSTLSIVLLGEITPQAICSRHGLMVGAKSIMVTKGVMALTAPLSFPVSKLLDYFLGEEIGNVYNRERLKELVKVTTDVNDLDKDEVNIISGALEMRKKTVSDVMTKLEDVFMLPISSVLDFETMSEIVKSGYSRIPVYEGGRGNIVTVLFIKDLAFVDPDDNTPLRTLCQYYQNPCNFVFEDVTLDVMFKQFKDGHKGHMAFVHRINNEGEGDPFYETIGLVTLEDVIEEMIQSEIVDETDVFLDNRSKRRRRPQNKLQDFAAFAERHENQRIHISPQLTLATFQFLSTSVDAFRPDTVSETVLRRLLKQDVIQYIKMKGKTKKDPTTYVFQQGKPVDYFLLILEGRVEVTVGRENLVFEAGPFTYFGVQALTQNIGVAESPTPSTMGSLQNINMDAMLRHTFVPDYSVRAITSLYYLTVKRSLYLAAKRATLMEKGNISKGGTNTQEFDTEVDKKLCNSATNIPISMLSRKLLGKSSTASTRDDAFSSTSAVKQTPRVNIIELMQVSQQNYPSSERMDVTDKYLKHLCNTASLTDPEKLLQSVDEDLSITGEHKTPSRQVSPHPMPASPAPRALEPRNGHAYAPTSSDEQERLLK